MMILTKAVFPDNNIRANWGALLIIYLNHQALEAQGPYVEHDSSPSWQDDLTSM
jgi:hypothetical protein